VAILYDSVAAALRDHLAVCDDLLRLAQLEAEALRETESFPGARIREQRKELLLRLESSSQALAGARTRWSQLKPPGGQSPPDLAELVQNTLDTIMRILVMDRENEQLLLRRGLLPPQALPSPAQSQPSFVARTYQRFSER